MPKVKKTKVKKFKRKEKFNSNWYVYVESRIWSLVSVSVSTLESRPLNRI